MYSQFENTKNWQTRRTIPENHGAGRRTYDYYEFWLASENIKARIQLACFFETEEIERWAVEWCEPLQHIQRHAGLTTSYEQMKQDQGGELRRAFWYLGVPDDNVIIEKCVQASSFQQMSGGRNPGEGVATAKVRKGIVGDWKNYFTRQDGELFHRLAGKYLIEFGYEKDENWYKKLPETLDL